MLNTSSEENISLFFPFFLLETLGSDINLLQGISSSDTKWKHLSLYPLATSDWEIPLNSSHLCRSLLWWWAIFPVTWVDPSLLLGKGREGRLTLQTRLNKWGLHSFFFFLSFFFFGGWGGKRWMMWKLYTARICDRPEKHLMNVHRRSTSRHKPLPFGSICYHVPFRHCVLPWKIENCAAVTAEHCSRKCRAAIMSDS